MLINILLLIVIFLSLIGIIFIISRKIFSLTNIDLEQIPKEKVARIKRELLEKKIIRQIGEWKDKLKAKKNTLKIYIKTGVDFLEKIKEKAEPRVKTGLIFLKNKIKFIKNKYEKRKQ